MCTLIVIHRVVPGLPAVFAANRDEYFDRPATGPIVLDPALGIVGGKDLVAGGTWMGLTPGGFFAGLTNQRQYGGPDRARRSRGEVVLETLSRGGAAPVVLAATNEAVLDLVPLEALQALAVDHQPRVSSSGVVPPVGCHASTSSRIRP